MPKPDPIEDAPPDWSEVDRLETATSAGDWPKRWMTIPEFDAELDRRGFWTSTLLTPAGRLEWLAMVFDGVRDPESFVATWPDLGGQYKHESLIDTPEEWRQLAEWMESKAKHRFGDDCFDKPDAE